MEGTYYTCSVSKGGNVIILNTMMSHGLDINSNDRNVDTQLMINKAAPVGMSYLLSRGAR